MMEELHPVISLGAGGITKLTDGKEELHRLNNPKYATEYLSAFDRVLADKEEAARYFHTH
jgi:oxygen-independent coproporphyrinogen-3 oxidase